MKGSGGGQRPPIDALTKAVIALTEWVNSHALEEGGERRKLGVGGLVTHKGGRQRIAYVAYVAALTRL